MNFIALLLGLVVERLATKFFHLRRLPWLDRLIDAGLRQLQKLATWPALLLVIVLALLLVLPVAAVSILLGDTLAGLPYVAFAVVVLFFSFGPKDIGEDVDEYCSALEPLCQETVSALSASQAQVLGSPGAGSSNVVRKAKSRMTALVDTIRRSRGAINSRRLARRKLSSRWGRAVGLNWLPGNSMSARSLL